MFRRFKFKQFIFFFLMGCVLILPHNTYAADVSGTTSFYIQRSNSGYGSVWYPNAHMTGGYDSGLNHCIGKSFWQGCDIPPIDDNLKQYYAITLQDLQLSYSFQANHVYTITANYWVGQYVYPDRSPLGFPVSHNNFGYASQGSFTINSFEQYDDGYSNHKAYRLIGTFVPRANYNSVILGIGNSDNDKVIFVGTSSTNSDNYVLQAGATVEESGSSTTNIAPIVEQQQQTNNKIDETNNKLNETNDNLEDINDSLTDETAPTGGGGGIDFDGFRQNVMSNTPITDLLTMPFTILNTLYNKIESESCHSWEITDDFLGHDLTFPCINPQRYFGTSIWNYIDTITSIFLVYQFAMLIISAYDSFTSLGDDFVNLYTPRHASNNSYEPKHGRG